VIGPRSIVPGVEWPAIPDAGVATTLALVWQLEQSQWWSADELHAAQVAQRDRVVEHARRSVPHYRAITTWDSVPILTRDAIIAAGDAVLSRAYPTTHGHAEMIATSRTTGAPVRVRATAVTQMLWHAITLREHAWHRRDLSASLAAVRYAPDAQAAPPDGVTARGWGPSTATIAPDAPMALLSIASTTDQQVAWLVAQQPTYFLTFPSVLDGILRRLAATNTRVPSIRGVRTTSEMLSPETRALCREVLGVGIEDMYSAAEVGYIALQCPEHEHYHVQSERLLVEILREDGTACAAGETGRVVVTDLHNFATPLLRYDIGDYAEVGTPCSCGRGLPVLRRIRGRRRNLLVYADGRTAFPLFTVACRAAARYRQMQLLQPALGKLVARIVPEGDFTPRDRNGLIAALHGTLGAEFAIEIEVVDSLERTPGGKLDEFVAQLG